MQLNDLSPPKASVENDVSPDLTTSRQPKIQKEALILIQLAIPNVGSYLMGSLHGLLTTIFVGQYLTTNDLSGVALGFTSVNLTGSAFITGLLSAMDTLCSQSHGAQNWKLYTNTTIRALVIVFCFALFIVIPIWMFSYEILITLNQPHEIAWRASQVCLLHIINIPAFTGIETLRRFLVCQSISKPMLYLGICSYLIFHPILLFTVFDIFQQKSYLWAPICQILSCYVYFISLLMYSIVSTQIIPETFIFPRSLQQWKEIISWNGDNLIQYHSVSNATEDEQEMDGAENQQFIVVKDGGMREYISLGFAGMFSYCGEWWIFEIITILSGILGKYQLAAHVITAQMEGFLFMIPLGISVAAAARIGHCIGHNDIILAKKLSIFVIILTLFISICVTIIGLIINYWIIELPHIFTWDENVVSIARDLLYLFFVLMINDALQSVLQGILRAMKQQKKTAIACFISLYCFGLPLAILFGFDFGAGLQIIGFWIAQNIGYLLFWVLLLSIFLKDKLWTLPTPQ